MSTASFSYAQAARGQSVPLTTPALSSSASALPTGPLEKQDASLAAGPQTVASLSTAIVNTGKASPGPSVLDSSSSPQKATSDDASPAVSSTLVGTLAESTSNFSLDDSSPQVALSDKGGRVSSVGTLSPSSDDATRKGAQKGKTHTSTGKDGDQSGPSEEMDKDKDAVRIELSPAPLPAVNVWNQRMMELAAKSKQSQSVTPNAVAPTSTAVANPTSAAIAAGGPVAKAKDAKKNGTVPTEDHAIPESTGNPPSSDAKAQPRRVADSTRSGSEQPRRSGPRGSRTSDKEDKSATASGGEPAPPVRDATLWPTPESATTSEETKGKTSPGKSDSVADKDVQDEVGSSKPRKKGWLPLPFVPTVNFQTPIPNVRGSKPKTGGRGGREVSSRGGYNSAVNGSTTSSEKASSTVLPTAEKVALNETAEAVKDGSSTVVHARQAPPLSGSSKRFSADNSHNQTRDIRKPFATTLPERPKDPVLFSYAGLATKAEFVPKGNHQSAANGESGGQHKQVAHTAQVDRRLAPTTKSVDHHSSAGKEIGQHPTKEHHGQPSRERAEARGERPSRGGFRGGRGGHSGSTAQSHHLPHSGHSAYQPNGQRVVPNGVFGGTTTTLPPTAIPFSPPSQQFSFGNSHNTQRLNARGNGRAQPAPLPAASYGGRLQNGVANPPRMLNYNGHVTQGLPTEFQMQQPISYQAFNPYVDAELLHGLTLQVDYYFSLDNLCKDVFLRRKMNDQGFVPLLVIAKFKRMAELAPSLDFIRAACEQSENLDYIVDQEQKEWIRSRFLWDSFVMPPEEREEEARKPGPDPRTVFSRSAHSRAQQAYLPAMMPTGYPPVAQPMFPGVYPNGGEMLFPPYDNWAQADHAPGHTGSAEVNGELNKGESQLSAAVPDFSPGSQGGAPTTLEDYQTYPDEQTEKLVVLVGPDAGGPGEVPQAKTAVSSNASHQLVEELYPALRARAFDQRKTAKPGETPSGMKHLYQFWTRCLTDKFNVRMYEEFRSSALEDARRIPPSDFGLRCLQRYYNSVLFGSSGARPYPAVFRPHHLETKQLLDSLKLRANGASRD